MKRRNALILAGLALVLVLCASIGTALAYFTTYAQTRGGFALDLRHRSEIEVTEKFSQWTKRITLTNSETAGPVFVRARAIAPTALTLQYLDESGKWTPGEDGFYYYGGVLNAGESTPELLAKIAGVPVAPREGESFNVVVVYESTPALYTADGTPYADWTSRLVTGGLS